jgi:tryptophan synthase alpha subunit
MNLIDRQFEKIRKEKRIGLMVHVVVGYPSLAATEEIVRIMAENGADFVELQIPFSDPLADGPTIMKASEAALRNGAKVKDAFILMRKLSKEVEIPLLFMGYYNTVFKYGTARFCKDAKSAGASGLIVPDIPLEEESQEHFIKSSKENDLYAIRVVSPASTKERLEKNAAVAEGFVYCMARQGITGAKKDLDTELVNYLKRVKKVFDVPLAVGFGISKREHIQALKGHVDMAIVGSAVIDVISKSKREQVGRQVKDFIHILTD